MRASDPQTTIALESRALIRKQVAQAQVRLDSERAVYGWGEGNELVTVGPGENAERSNLTGHPSHPKNSL